MRIVSGRRSERAEKVKNATFGCEVFTKVVQKIDIAVVWKQLFIMVSMSKLRVHFSTAGIFERFRIRTQI